MASNIPLREGCEEQNILEPPAAYNPSLEACSTYTENSFSNGCESSMKSVSNAENALSISDVEFENNFNHRAEIEYDGQEDGARGVNIGDIEKTSSSSSLENILENSNNIINVTNTKDRIRTRNVNPKDVTSSGVKEVKPTSKVSLVNKGFDKMGSSSSSADRDPDSPLSISSDSESFSSFCYGIEELSVINSPNEKTGAIRKLKTTIKNSAQLTVENLQPPNNYSIINEVKYVHMGHIYTIGDLLVTIQAKSGAPSYDIGTLLFADDNGSLLGSVCQVTDSCQQPPLYYIKREEMKIKNFDKGQKVYTLEHGSISEYFPIPNVAELTRSSHSNDQRTPPPTRCPNNKLSPPDESSSPSPAHRHHHRRRRRQRLSSSQERHRRFEETMNVENTVNTQIHRMRDAFILARRQKSPRGFAAITTSAHSRIITQASPVEEYEGGVVTTTVAPSEGRYPGSLPQQTVMGTVSSTIHLPSTLPQPPLLYPTSLPPEAALQPTAIPLMVSPWVSDPMLLRPTVAPPPPSPFMQPPPPPPGLLACPPPPGFLPPVGVGYHPVPPTFVPFRVGSFVGSTNVGTMGAAGGGMYRLMGPQPIQQAQQHQLEHMRARGIYMPGGEYMRPVPFLVPVMGVPMAAAQGLVVRPPGVPSRPTVSARPGPQVSMAVQMGPHVPSTMGIPQQPPRVVCQPPPPGMPPMSTPGANVALVRRGPAVSQVRPQVRILQPPNRESSHQGRRTMPVLPRTYLPPDAHQEPSQQQAQGLPVSIVCTEPL